MGGSPILLVTVKGAMSTTSGRISSDSVLQWIRGGGPRRHGVFRSRLWKRRLPSRWTQSGFSGLIAVVEEMSWWRRSWNRTRCGFLLIGGRPPILCTLRSDSAFPYSGPVIPPGRFRTPGLWKRFSQERFAAFCAQVQREQNS